MEHVVIDVSEPLDIYTSIVIGGVGGSYRGVGVRRQWCLAGSHVNTDCSTIN